MRASLADPRLKARIVDSHVIPGLSAGSGLVWSWPYLVAVQDEAWAAVKIDPQSCATERVVFSGNGNPLPKALKPDFEAVFAADSGVLYMMGSGSSARRRAVAVLNPSLGTSAVHDASGLFGALEDLLGTVPNVEGAVLMGDVVRLFNRGAGERPSATVDVSLSELFGTSPLVSGLLEHHLGRIGPVPLAFTDVTLMADGRCLYLAAAEDTDDAVADGQVLGSVVGVLDEVGGRWTHLMEPDGTPSLRKAEGIALEPGGRAGFLITDADDPSRCTDLCRFELIGPW